MDGLGLAAADGPDPAVADDPDPAVAGGLDLVVAGGLDPAVVGRLDLVLAGGLGHPAGDGPVCGHAGLPLHLSHFPSHPPTRTSPCLLPYN